MAKRRRTSRPKKKKGRSVVRNNQVVANEPEELTRAPHSFVMHRGTVGSNIADLTKDFRKVMDPFTATSLKARKANTIKDFLSVSGLLHVTHMCIFTSADTGHFLKIARVPRGPTLYFKIINYSLARDVISNLKKQLVFQRQFEHSPLVILNNFSGDVVYLKLMTSMFQNMFPSINLTKVNLNEIRRCVLFNYNPDTKLIDFRHFAIKVSPVGLSRGVKKIVDNKVPNLARFQDISEFISKADLLSGSEAEDDPASHVTLSQNISSRGNMPTSKSAIRLVELGPRMTLQLIKIEDGLMTGEVLYHENITKTEEEKAQLLKRLKEKRKLKEERKRIQEMNKRKKEEERLQLKKKSLSGMMKHKNPEEVEPEDDNDVEWYKKEVGKEPEDDLFHNKPKGGLKRKKPFNGPLQRKRLKKEKLESEKVRKGDSKKFFKKKSR